MSQTVGDRLGPYEILAPIGAGGMGEVYRAKDTRLGRDVALKILPPHLAVDRDRLSQFSSRSAGGRRVESPQRGDTPFSRGKRRRPLPDDGARRWAVVVGGDSTRQAWPSRERVDVAAAVTDAIAARTSKGIVHRDLKPANVMITRDGRVKVLDFGLAKEMRGPRR